MAKKAILSDREFSPVKSGLVRSVVCHGTTDRASLIPRHGRDESAVVGHQRLVDARSHGHPSAETELSRRRLTREKRVLLSQAEEQALNETVQRLAVAGATSLKLSSLIRAFVALLWQVESLLIARILATGGPIRPSNGDGRAIEEYERGLALLLADAVRDAPHHQREGVEDCY